MPERIHTKFEDEPVGSLARYARELHKYQKITPSEIDQPQYSQSTGLFQSNGVKRSRDGSPKSPKSIQSTHFPAPADAERREEGVNEKKPCTVDGVENTEDLDSKTEKDETINVKEQRTVAPKSFYGNSQGLNVASQTKRSSSVDSSAPRGGSENGITPKHTPHNTPVSRFINGRKASAIRKSSVDSDDSRGTSIGQRPTHYNLQRIKRELLEVRKALPIWAHKADIRWSLRHTDVLLLVGETGSGKSTQVPQFLTSEPWFKQQAVKADNGNGNERRIRVGGMIAITEPRRIAATSLAHRVAQETGSYLGKGQTHDQDQVGYSVRFDAVIPRNCRIKFLTEGMLLQELLHDPHLRKYSAVIIDEIHERSVDADLLTGFLRNLVRGDKSGRGGVPLKLVVMSATANMEGLQNFFSVETSLAEMSFPSIHDDSLKTNQRASQTNMNRRELAANGHNSMKGGTSESWSNNSLDRRVSDASYSSWDGIVSEDEKSRYQDPEEGPPCQVPADCDRTPVSTTTSSHESAFASREEYSSMEIDYKDVIIHHIKGRQHPVKIFYTQEPVADYLEATLKTIFKIHTEEPLPGDILVFLTGQEEIESLKGLVQKFAESLNKALPRLKVFCLFGNQAIEQQHEAFASTIDKRTRRVVLATNIAETSVTVPGVRFVVDCGKAKIKQHRVRLGLQSLLVKPISKSSAIQRKGRAGREAPGKCYRLYTEAEYLKLHEIDLPEILRSDISEAVLQMKARGVRDVTAFPLMDPPDIDALEKALMNLHSIGALNDDGELTETGSKMASFPLPPAYSRVIVAAAEPEADCLLEAIDIIACLTAGDDIFMQRNFDENREKLDDIRHDLLRREGDIITYLTTMQKYAAENSNRSIWCDERLVSARDMKQAISIRRQLRNICVREKMLAEKPPADPQSFVPIAAERTEILLKCFMKAFAMKTATLQPDGSYCTTIGRHLIAIHPSSGLYGKKLEAIMFLEHVFTQRNYAKKVSAIQMNWIAEMLEMS